MRISGPAYRYILTLAVPEQRAVVDGLHEIRNDPLGVGTQLPFPYMPGTLGYVAGGFFVTYRLKDDIPEVGAVTRMPSMEDFAAALGK